MVLCRDTVLYSQQMTFGDGMVSPPSDDPILAIVVRDCWTQSISDSGQGLSDFEMMQLVLLSASIRTQDPGGPEVPVPPQRSGKTAHKRGMKMTLEGTGPYDAGGSREGGNTGK